MGSYNHSAMREGDLAGTRDVGFVNWTIRWQTAGWSYRDDMNVWVHTGVLIDYEGFGNKFYMADMYGLRPDNDFGVFKIDTYMNGPGGNPSINDLRRSKSINANAAVKLWLRSLVTGMKNGSYGYDWGGLFGSIGGMRTWNSSSKYLCTEMSFHLICSAERAAGYRITKNGTPFWPRLYGSVGSAYKNRERDWGIMWNVPYIGDMTSPWNMKRGCAWGCTWLSRSQIYY